MLSEELDTILSQIKIFDRRFRFAIVTNHADDDANGWLVWLEYDEADVDTGQPATQKSRKWFVHCDATETDVVETCFAAVMRSYDHVVKEHFTYRGRRVHSPHFTIEQRLSMVPGASPAPGQTWGGGNGPCMCNYPDSAPHPRGSTDHHCIYAS